jgi:23S rRNA (adenine2503-C2)-methyltransferase
MNAESTISETDQTSFDFFATPREELEKVLKERFGAASYRAQQLYQWVYQHGLTDVSEMSNLSGPLRSILSNSIDLSLPAVHTEQISKDGTRKYLVESSVGLVETVLIHQPGRKTLCVSSQVGCGMGCKFCRTGTMGFLKNLTASDIVRQVVTVRRSARSRGEDFSNIVFMGMGEPLHNFKSVVKAVRILTDQHGLSFAPRRITVSTVGLVPAIDKFADNINANLAVSLNATSDEVRSEIMPINRRFPLAELSRSLRALSHKLGRKRITIEYVMLAGVNDTDADLRRLPQVLEGVRSKINLIPYNENAGLGFNSPQKKTIDKWFQTLTAQGHLVTVRWSKGDDIDAACGQLKTTAGSEPKTSPDESFVRDSKLDAKESLLQGVHFDSLVDSLSPDSSVML